MFFLDLCDAWRELTSMVLFILVWRGGLQVLIIFLIESSLLSDEVVRLSGHKFFVLIYGIHGGTLSASSHGLRHVGICFPVPFPVLRGFDHFPAEVSFRFRYSELCVMS